MGFKWDDNVVRGAEFDASGIYRYRLWRVWAPEKPCVVFVMLNPSTADGRRDDPTIRRCMGFASAWGYGSLEVVNLFAYRCTDPQGLRDAVDPVGPENDTHLLAAIEKASLLIAAWGNKGSFRMRHLAVRTIVTSRSRLHCLGLTAAGQPRHPLHSSGKLLPIPLN